MAKTYHRRPLHEGRSPRPKQRAEFFSDRRTKRQRTRGAKLRAALAEQ